MNRIKYPNRKTKIPIKTTCPYNIVQLLVEY